MSEREVIGKAVEKRFATCQNGGDRQIRFCIVRSVSFIRDSLFLSFKSYGDENFGTLQNQVGQII